MIRRNCPQRHDWKEHAESLGFKFHTMYGEPYWNEGVYYEFTMDQIDVIEEATNHLHIMALAAAETILNSEDLLKRLSVPEMYWDTIRKSFYEPQQLNHLYGRFDFILDNDGTPRMLEYNADTPTSLYESAHYQWLWKDKAIEQGLIDPNADQFNGIEDMLIERFSKMFKPGEEVYFTSFEGQEEDYATVEYMAACAKDAGMVCEYIPLQSISLNTDDKFCTKEGKVIESLFKLYPWEDMFLDDYGPSISDGGVRWVEPIWKSLISNKGILPVLWEMFPDHPNLIPSYFEEDIDIASLVETTFVRKPIFSREGSSVDRS